MAFATDTRKTGPTAAALLAGGLIVALAVLLLPAPDAFAQRVCQPGDAACNEQRMRNTREDALFPGGRNQLDGRPHLSRRYYGDRNVPALGQQGRCDVNPVISGQRTRVVRTC